MSRFYEGDGDNPVGIMWSANVERVCRGKRGQKILREFVAALLALPERRLIANEIENAQGEVCAVGALAKYRGVDMSDYDDSQDGTIELAQAMGLGFMLGWQLGAENDLYCERLHLQRRSILLDVPVIDEEYANTTLRWKTPNLTMYGAPRSTRYVTISGDLRGFSPEERWQHLYQWASSRIKWDLPVRAQ